MGPDMTEGPTKAIDHWGSGNKKGRWVGFGTNVDFDLAWYTGKVRTDYTVWKANGKSLLVVTSQLRKPVACTEETERGKKSHSS